MKKIISFISLAVLMLVMVGCGKTTTKKEKYTVKFTTDTTDTIADQIVTKGKKVTRPTDPVKEGYTFDGWYLGDKKWVFNGYNVIRDITLTARWSEQQYKVTYILNGGTNASNNPTKYYYTTETINLKDPTKIEGIFDGWYTEPEFVNKVEQIKKGSIGDITLYAKWAEYMKPYEANGSKYIYFGEYPQTLKGESVTIISTTPDSNGYYLGSDNELYAKVVAKSYSYNTIYFNNKQQIVEGTTYYFKVEPIKWKILQVNGTEYKLVTDLIIDYQKFHSSRYARTIDGKTIYLNNYEYSDIRKWLNEDFYNKAFTKELQAYINTTFVDNSSASTGDSSNKYICNDTYDKVYLLSYKDVTNKEYGFTDKASRQKRSTDYSKAVGLSKIKYWLRSPINFFDYDSIARYVDYSGDIDINWVSDDDVGVSTAITINLNGHCDTHIKSNLIKDSDPTCITKGYSHIECTICHDIIEVIETEESKELGHYIIHHERVNPTCTTWGHTGYDTCSRCDYTTYLGANLMPQHNWILRKCTICNKTTNKVYEKEGQKYIYFGEYPQTLKDENVTITNDTPDSNGYYLGSDNERYAKVNAKPNSSTHYFNNKQQIVNGTTYYFKVEPIKWRILQVNGTEYKLVTDLIIDYQKFNASDDTRTIDGKTIYANNYEYSDIRKWLNEDFYNKAFTKELQSYINTTFVDNSLASTGGRENKYICNDTYDKVYLLSYKDVTNEEYGFTDYASREKQSTDYAKAVGLSGRNYYWLRSPFSSISVDRVGSYGVVDSTWVNNGGHGVSAAITISLS